MYRKIAFLLILTLISINIHAQITHNLIVQRKNYIYFYNFTQLSESLKIQKVPYL